MSTEYFLFKELTGNNPTFRRPAYINNSTVMNRLTIYNFEAESTFLTLLDIDPS
jgi:hypothetical protein